MVAKIKIMKHKFGREPWEVWKQKCRKQWYGLRWNEDFWRQNTRGKLKAELKNICLILPHSPNSETISYPIPCVCLIIKT